jgi:hypothetical protein
VPIDAGGLSGIFFAFALWQLRVLCAKLLDHILFVAKRSVFGDSIGRV